jgi:hypothetical protein
MAETTLDQLIPIVAARYGGPNSALTGSATGGSTSTLIDTSSLWQPDNSFVNRYLRMTGGSNSGGERLVTASTQATKTLTFDPAFSASVTAGDTYQVLPRMRQDFVTAIQEAIRAAGDTWLQVKTVENIAYTNAQEYSLPADLFLVMNVFIGVADAWVPFTAYEVAGAPGAYKLFLRQGYDHSNIAASSTTYFRIVYAANPTLLTGGADSLLVGEVTEREALTFIVEYALHILHEGAMAGNITGEAARAHLTLAQQHLAKAREVEQRAKPPRVPRRSTSRAIPRHI